MTEGFVGDPMDDALDTMLTVDVRRGIVHRGLCDRLPKRGDGGWRWTPEVAGTMDRACRVCLPDGLPGA